MARWWYPRSENSIFKSGCKKQGRVLAHALTQTVETRLWTHPHRLFLESQKGFLIAKLFKIVIEEFIKWWKLDHPEQHCLLFSDNLRIHTNWTIMKKTSKHGALMLNIMPAISYWLHVHDQLPFANLKKQSNKEQETTSVGVTKHLHYK